MPATDSIASTRDRIIECAESLFADRGFEGVSVREITQEAGANVAAINYHFGSRDGLIDVVLERFIVPVNTARLELLTALIEKHPKKLPVRGVVECFVRPLIEQVEQSELSQRLFLKMLGRCLSSEVVFPESVRPLVQKVIEGFSGALCTALPKLPPDIALWRLHFSLGALIHTLGHADTLQDIAPDHIGTPDHAAVLAHLIDYCTAGLQAPPPKST